MNFSIKDFFSKCDQIRSKCDQIRSKCDQIRRELLDDLEDFLHVKIFRENKERKTKIVE